MQSAHMALSSSERRAEGRGLLAQPALLAGRGGGAFPLSMDKSPLFHLQLHRLMGKSTPAFSLKVELILIDF